LSEELPEKIVDAVLENLRGRKGFDWVFDDLDDDIHEEMRADLIDTVRNQMN
jgi:hypothetical protein